MPQRQLPVGFFRLPRANAHIEANVDLPWMRLSVENSRTRQQRNVVQVLCGGINHRDDLSERYTRFCGDIGEPERSRAKNVVQSVAKVAATERFNVDIDEAVPDFDRTVGRNLDDNGSPVSWITRNPPPDAKRESNRNRRRAGDDGGSDQQYGHDRSHLDYACRTH
jgi:hypothetical protein